MQGSKKLVRKRGVDSERFFSRENSVVFFPYFPPNLARITPSLLHKGVIPRYDRWRNQKAKFRIHEHKICPKCGVSYPYKSPFAIVLSSLSDGFINLHRDLFVFVFSSLVLRTISRCDFPSLHQRVCWLLSSLISVAHIFKGNICKNSANSCEGRESKIFHLPYLSALSALRASDCSIHKISEIERTCKGKRF